MRSYKPYFLSPRRKKSIFPAEKAEAPADFASAGASRIGASVILGKRKTLFYKAGSNGVFPSSLPKPQGCLEISTLFSRINLCYAVVNVFGKRSLRWGALLRNRGILVSEEKTENKKSELS